MSAFNTVACVAQCPHCNKQAGFVVQFKYGETWQYEYSVGDKLIWSDKPRHNIGKPGFRRVVVDGVGGPCKCCGCEELDFDILIDHGCIAAVKIHSVENDYSSFGDTYIVQEE